MRIQENLEKSKEMIALAHSKGLSIECEVGLIGWDEDVVISAVELADPQECKTIADLGVDFLAAGIGNIHGIYPKDWKGLHFDALEKIHQATDHIPLVLHGGTGIPYDMIKKAISCGISKININTELQVTWHKAVVDFIKEKTSIYDPRKVIGSGEVSMKDKINELVDIFNPNHISSKN